MRSDQTRSVPQPDPRRGSDGCAAGPGAAPNWSGGFYIDDYCPMVCDRNDDGVCLELGDTNTTVRLILTQEGLMCLSAVLDQAVVATLRRRNVLPPALGVVAVSGSGTSVE